MSIFPAMPRFARLRSIHRIPLLLAASTLALLAGCEDSPAGAVATACGEGPLRLRPGEAVDVPADVQCELAAQDGARYALAYYDAQLAVMAETQPEPFAGTGGSIRLTVTEGTGSAGGTGPAPALAPAADPADHAVLPAGPHAATGVLSEGPWSTGETLQFGAPLCTEVCSGRVARVHDGWLVLAVDDATLGAEADRAIAWFDEIVPLFVQHALPLLHGAFTAERPVTSLASGQLVVLFRGNVSSVGGFAYTQVSQAGSATHVIQLELEQGMTSATVLEVLSHEVAHTFQWEYLARSAPAPGQAGARAQGRWGTEGGATLAAKETLRRATGHAPGGNLDFRAAPASALEGRLFRHSGIGGGSFVAGYTAGAGFLEDLSLRLAAAGEAPDAALREVLRGASEGWYGVTGSTPGRQGLAARMRARIPGWNPADAVLTWTLSAGADDVLPDAQYQNRAWLRLGSVGPETTYGWQPLRTLDGGTDVSESFTRAGGTNGWLLLRDTGRGVRVQVGSPASVLWRLLRIS